MEFLADAQAVIIAPELFYGMIRKRSEVWSLESGVSSQELGVSIRFVSAIIEGSQNPEPDF